MRSSNKHWGWLACVVVGLLVVSGWAGVTGVEAAPLNAATCTIVTDELNLRNGPGMNYDVVDKLSYGMTFWAVGQALSTQDRRTYWVYGTVNETEEEGWLSASPAYLACALPAARLPRAIIPPLPPEVGINLPPDDAIVEYYALINQGQYEQTWQALRRTFRSRVNQNDFHEYKKFWDSVALVEVFYPTVVAQSLNRATVRAYIQYTSVTGRVSSDPRFQFTLVRDTLHGGWLIETTSRY